MLSPTLARQVSVGQGSMADGEGLEEDEDFLNFTFNNLGSLLQRNLELAANSPMEKPADVS